MIIVLGILMFMGLVLIHELGHFISAKKSGVKVLEFGIGIPPRVCKLWKDKSGTQYTLNLIPLGGFVRLKGEDPKDEQDFNAKDSFIKAKIWKKIIILIAGVSMNFLAARLLFSFIFWQGTKPISLLPENAFTTTAQSYLLPTLSFLQAQGFTSGDVAQIPLQIISVWEDGLGYTMGIKTGDILLQVNDTAVDFLTINSTIQKHIGESITLHYQRGNTIMIATGMCGEDDCILGFAFAQPDDLIQEIKFPLGKAMFAGLQEIGGETKLTLNALGSLGKNLLSFDRSKINSALNKLTGPVGAVKIGELLLEEGGWKLYLGFAGLISLALAIFNILPLPALDGGRLLGVLIQGIGKLKPEKYFTVEGYINVIFFFLLIGLGIYILLKDLVRFRDIKIPFIG